MMGPTYEWRHARTYTPAQTAWLEEHTDLVPAIYWLAIGSVIAAFALARAVESVLSARARRRAAQAALRPSWADSRPVKPRRQCGAAIVALVRRLKYDQPRWLEKLCVGSVGHLMLLVFFLGANAALALWATSIGRPHFSPDIDWVAHHCAMLCFANVPLIIGLAGKNNVVSLLTGIPYEGLSLLHRWSARLIPLLSSVHMAGRIYTNVPTTAPWGRNADGRSQSYVLAGWVAYGLFLGLVIVASRPIRNVHYSLFKVGHIILVLGAIVSLFIHRPERIGWLFAGVGLWALDRLWRLSRILINYCSASDRADLARGSKRSATTHTVTTTQLWPPGAHAYLNCPSLRGGGSHPFSVSSIAQPIDSTDEDGRPYSAQMVFIIRVRGGFTRKLYLWATGEMSIDQRQRHLLALPPSTERALERWQRRLSRRVVDADAVISKYQFRALPLTYTEGPYGRRNRFGDDYETLVLFAGGSGVSYSLPIVLDIVRRARAMALGKCSSAVVTQRLVFVWVVRDVSHLDWIEESLRDAMEHAPPGLLHLRIFCSQADKIPRRLRFDPKFDLGHVHRFRAGDVAPPPPSGDYFSLDRKGSSNLSTPAGSIGPPSAYTISDPRPPYSNARREPIRFLGGRPNVDQIIEHEISMTAPGDHVAIGCCGPTSLGQSVSAAVANAIKPGLVYAGENRRNVRLALEEFGW